MLVTNARHAACLRAAGEALDAARRALAEGRGEDLLALDLRRAIAALGEIIGAVGGDDVLDAIFSRFCIGK
jgi:tRNA modification GTPase